MARATSVLVTGFAVSPGARSTAPSPPARRTRQPRRSDLGPVQTARRQNLVLGLLVGDERGGQATGQRRHQPGAQGLSVTGQGDSGAGNGHRPGRAELGRRGEHVRQPFPTDPGPGRLVPHAPQDRVDTLDDRAHRLGIPHIHHGRLHPGGTELVEVAAAGVRAPLAPVPHALLPAPPRADRPRRWLRTPQPAPAHPSSSRLTTSRGRSGAVAHSLARQGSSPGARIGTS